MTEFVEKLPVWNAEGTEPPISKVETGWKIDERPPAEYMNYLQSTTYVAIKELQEKAVHNDTISEIQTDITEAKQIAESAIEQTTENHNQISMLTNKSNLNGIINRSKMDYVPLLNGQADWFKGTWRPAALDGDWIFGDNSIKPTFTNLTSGGVSILHKSSRIQDGEIGITMKGYDIEATANSAAGIAFNGKNTNDYIAATVMFNLKQVWIGTLKDGTYQNVRSVDISNPQIIPKNGESINLSVKTYGNVFSVFLNGTEVIKDQVSSYLNTRESNGLWGLLVYNGSTNIDTFTKNIVFSNLYTKEYDFSTISKMDKVFHPGDSISAGAGVTVEERWTELLKTEMVKINPNYTSVNVAVSGSPTSVILDQVKQNVKGYDLVTLLGGTNNARIDSVGTTIESAVTDMRYMIRLAKAYGVIPVVGTCLPIDRTKLSPAMDATTWAWLTEYNNQIRMLCANEKVICVDFYNEFNNALIKLQADKIHPNPDGQKLMFEVIYRVISGKIRTL
ncbi:SGNH/GDSL hydrolase family protein [Bacillus cereus]|uniref:SGNH/GDSL hydrolase family protein n=1 Tax=Bacillus cereus TaxID=1396 RepID=UPI0028530456|nr:SGNH/GDSL hydrolase family protein [Bacillus cereus]MDR4987150.1 SGNH/GDSL hydrolase family protein [Bacillus cereus]